MAIHRSLTAVKIVSVAIEYRGISICKTYYVDKIDWVPLQEDGWTEKSDD